MRVDTVEDRVKELLFQRLQKLKDVESSEIVKDSPRINELKIDIAKKNDEINNLMSALAKGNEITIEYINQSISRLDKEKNELLDELTNLQLKSQKEDKGQFDIDNILNEWDSYNTELKKRITKIIIDFIVVEGNNVDIKFF